MEMMEKFPLQKLRGARQLKEVAAVMEFSNGALSQAERGQTTISASALTRLATCYGEPYEKVRLLYLQGRHAYLKGQLKQLEAIPGVVPRKRKRRASH